MGPLPGARLALTCVYSPPDEEGSLRVVEADVRLDGDEAWTAERAPCSRAYDVQSVLTHELGHVGGLDHPGVASTSTMNRAVRACDTSGRTLSGEDLVTLHAIVP